MCFKFVHLKPTTAWSPASGSASVLGLSSGVFTWLMLEVPRKQQFHLPFCLCTQRLEINSIIVSYCHFVAWVLLYHFWNILEQFYRGPWIIWISKNGLPLLLSMLSKQFQKFVVSAALRWIQTFHQRFTSCCIESEPKKKTATGGKRQLNFSTWR